jgi:hypothetical protein
MSIGNVGGNGSVQWEFRVDAADTAKVQYQDTFENNGNHRRGGTDKNDNAAPGGPLTVSLEIPAGKTEAQFRGDLAAAQKVGNRLEIGLTIEPDNPNQVRIRWGRHV